MCIRKNQANKTKKTTTTTLNKDKTSGPYYASRIESVNKLETALGGEEQSLITLSFFKFKFSFYIGQYESFLYTELKLRAIGMLSNPLLLGKPHPVISFSWS